MAAGQPAGGMNVHLIRDDTNAVVFNGVTDASGSCSPNLPPLPVGVGSHWVCDANSQFLGCTSNDVTELPNDPQVGTQAVASISPNPSDGGNQTFSVVVTTTA